MSSMTGEIVRVTALADLPEHETVCPQPPRGKDICPKDFAPTYNGEEYRFKRGETKILPVNVARHFQRVYRDVIVVEGSPINVQDVLTMAAKDPKNLEAFMRAGTSGKPIEVRVGGGAQYTPGNTMEEALGAATSENGTGHMPLVAV